jgi:hypothetical protein
MTQITRENVADSPQATRLLILLAIAGVITSLFAWSRLNDSRAHALAAAGDLAVCRQDLADLDNWHTEPSSGAGIISADPELNHLIQGAAVIAQMSDQLASIEPGPPARIRDTDNFQTPIYLRLNSVTLRQLVTFLHQLSSSDSAVRTAAIELSPPESASSAPTQNAEPWMADVTLAYLTYAPKAAANP